MRPNTLNYHAYILDIYKLEVWKEIHIYNIFDGIKKDKTVYHIALYLNVLQFVNSNTPKRLLRNF